MNWRVGGAGGGVKMARFYWFKNGTHLEEEEKNLTGQTVVKRRPSLFLFYSREVKYFHSLFQSRSLYHMANLEEKNQLVVACVTQSGRPGTLGRAVVNF